jgi:hypothetical protein
MSGWIGSTAIVLTQNGGNVRQSVSGVHVSPELVVFQTPPVAAPRYQVLARCGSNATACGCR